MGVKTLQITVHDLQPYYYFHFRDSNGNIDLTGATLRTTLKNIETGTRVINRATDRTTVTSATGGLGEVRWSAGDTDVIGIYALEIEVTPSSGGKFTFPPRGERALVEIVKAQDTQ